MSHLKQNLRLLAQDNVVVRATVTAPEPGKFSVAVLAFTLVPDVEPDKKVASVLFTYDALDDFFVAGTTNVELSDVGLERLTRSWWPNDGGNHQVRVCVRSNAHMNAKDVAIQDWRFLQALACLLADLLSVEGRLELPEDRYAIKRLRHRLNRLFLEQNRVYGKALNALGVPI